MPDLVLFITIMVIIACSAYLIFERIKNQKPDEKDVLPSGGNRKEVDIAKAFGYGFCGGLISAVLIFLLLSMFNIDGPEEFIAIGIIIISAVICACTSIVVQTLKNIASLK